MNYINQLATITFLALSSLCSAQCDILFMAKDTGVFDCTARIVAFNGEHLNTYDMENQIAVSQPTCNTNSSYVYSFYRDGVLMDRVVLLRVGNSNEFEVTQDGVGLIRVEGI